jgi:hypothetical protein
MGRRRIGKDPTKVKARFPSLLIDRTIKPKVSVCAQKPIVFDASVPGTKMRRLPFGVVSHT